MPTKTETAHAGEFIVSESNGTRSREVVTIASGTPAIKAGEVLGQITSGGEYTVYDDAATDGTEDAAAVLVGDVDASAAAKEAVVIIRDAEVRLSGLTFQSGQDATDQANAVTDLAALGIIAR